MEVFGIPFQVAVSNASEALDSSLDPVSRAVVLAQRKARAVATQRESGFVLGADTIVVQARDLLGKPKDDADAASMLRALSGRDHVVITGIALVDAGSGVEHTAAVSSTVQFRSLSDDEIARYIASGEPRDKAGAYAIQGLGAGLVVRFDGCFTNVVGLPLCETARLLDDAGLSLATTPPVCRLADGTPCPRLV